MEDGEEWITLEELMVELEIKTRATLKKHVLSDSRLTTIKIGNVTKTKRKYLNKYIESKALDSSRERRAIRLQEHAGKPGAGVFPVAERDATAEGSAVLRFIARFGCVPDNSPYWKNARYVGADLPIDIAVAFGLPAGTSFEVAVERAETLLDLPSDKLKVAMTQVAKRLAAYHADGEGEGE